MIKNYMSYFEIKETTDNLLATLKDTVNIFEKMIIDFKMEKCTIDKWDRDYPLFCSKVKNSKNETNQIYLAVEEYTHYNQAAYQLSHEMAHLYIYLNNNDNNKISKWIEETICEAFSLYILKLYRDEYDSTSLSKIYPNCSESFNEYLNGILKKDIFETLSLSNCSSLEKLKEIDNCAETKREYRKKEMIFLFNILNENNLEGLIKYKDFIYDNTKNNIKLLNTKLYKESFPNNIAVEYLCRLQDKIISI